MSDANHVDSDHESVDTVDAVVDVIDVIDVDVNVVANADANAVANAVANAAANANANAVANAADVSAVANAANAANVVVANTLVLEPAPVIVDVRLDERIEIDGAVITNKQGTTADAKDVTLTTFDTVPHADNDDITIKEDLRQTVESYYDNLADSASESSRVVNDIKQYAAKIKCENFQGKGTIDDYSELFVAASKIANETKQMQLAVDISGFNEFAAAADDLSNLFNGFIVKLQSINIVDDLNFLKAVRDALEKIARLADVFGEFKKTIIATASVELPKSAHETRVVVEEVMSEINCAMNYMNHFITPSDVKPANADLSATEKNIIEKAVSTIENWSVLCEQDVTVAMAHSPDVVYMKAASAELRSKAATVRNNVVALRAKLDAYRRL
jgi:hypothetical protein